MDEWESSKNSEGDEKHYIQTKFPSGMTGEFGWWLEYRPDVDELILWPFLTVYKKRKKKWPNDHAETTGKDGLLPAMWAMQMLQKGVESYLEDYLSVRVCIQWADSRRRDVYEKVLSKRYGFYFTHFDGFKVLEKIYGG